jgi:predicted phage-related endonuclease
MTIQFISSKDEAVWLEKRKSYITSTESASLFNLQMPSMPTAFELWHIKNGLKSNDIEVNSYMQWGRIMQAAIEAIIKEDNPDWKIRPMETFAYDDVCKMGSSFDNVIETARGIGLLEIKTTSYRDYKAKFTEDDETDFIECPPYYEVQGQHQLEMINKYDYVCFAVAILDTREIKYIFRDRDVKMGGIIRNKIKEFWAMKEPPPPDLEKDSDLLALMHRANSNNSSYNAMEDTDFNMAALSYIEATTKAKAAETAKKIARSQMILAMGENNSAYSASARVNNNKSFRVTATKGE